MLIARFSHFDRSTAILADDVERILADFDANHGDFAVELLSFSNIGIQVRPEDPMTLHRQTDRAAN